LIGETEFVVPQRCNVNLNRLIQRDILGDGLGVSYRAIAISLFLCALALAEPRRRRERALSAARNRYGFATGSCS
jgi:hypothetical protein